MVLITTKQLNLSEIQLYIVKKTYSQEINWWSSCEVSDSRNWKIKKRTSQFFLLFPMPLSEKPQLSLYSHNRWPKYGEIWHFWPKNQVSDYRIWIYDIAHLEELEKLNQIGRKPRKRFLSQSTSYLFFPKNRTVPGSSNIRCSDISCGSSVLKIEQFQVSALLTVENAANN